MILIRKSTNNRERIIASELSSENYFEATFRSSCNLESSPTKPCKCATLADIRKCINTLAPTINPTRLGEWNPFNNCGTWVIDLSSKCCLDITLETGTIFGTTWSLQFGSWLSTF